MRMPRAQMRAALNFVLSCFRLDAGASVAPRTSHRRQFASAQTSVIRFCLLKQWRCVRLWQGWCDVRIFVMSDKYP